MLARAEECGKGGESYERSERSSPRLQRGKRRISRPDPCIQVERGGSEAIIASLDRAQPLGKFEKANEWRILGQYVPNGCKSTANCKGDVRYALSSSEMR